jgi:hypothetical protein
MTDFSNLQQATTHSGKKRVAAQTVLTLEDREIDVFLLASGGYRIGMPSVRIALIQDPLWATNALSALTENGLQLAFGNKSSIRPTQRAEFCSKEIPVSDLITVDEFLSVLEKFVVWEEPESKPTTTPLKKEGLLRDKLCLKLNAQKEVACPAGRIDALSEDLIIEVKTAKSWKSALGQVLAYGNFYPSHKKAIYLFDVPDKFDAEKVADICSVFDVQVFYVGELA